MTGTVPVPAERLREFAAAVLVAAGMAAQDAGTAAEAMVWSDLRGAFTQGATYRVPQAVQRLRAGGVNPRPAWRVVSQTAGFALLDADGGWGQVAGTRAMRLAIGKARTGGVGAAVVRDADVTAAMGWYPAVAVRERMIGLAINNTVPLMPPWGGTTKLLGNQAFALGAPSGRHGPVLFDSAVTAMSNSGINAAKRRGEKLPAGVAVDSAGEPTRDPDAALAGALLPMGGHRGYGLALLWEVLTGVLAGGRMAPDVGGPSPAGTPMGVSLFCLAIDPRLGLPYEAFTARVDRLVDQVHASPAGSGSDPPRVPGERGNRLAADHDRAGIPLPADSLARLCAVGEELGVRWS